MDYLYQGQTGSGKKRIFLFLMLYRWITLINVIILSFINAKKVTGLSIAMVLTYNIALSIFAHRLFKKAEEHPSCIVLDLLFCILMLDITGGWASPFYLYSLSPILMAALLIKLKGALYFSSAFSLLYMAVLFHNGYSIAKISYMGRLDSLISNHVTFFLIGIFFAYPSLVLNELEILQQKLIKAKEDVESSQKELKITNKLTLLSKRELQVLHLAAEGKSNKEIADSLFLSESTVKTHLSRIFKKLRLRSRAEAISFLKDKDNSTTVVE
jgi:DNA-binding CsgD family transcriptional regulator